MTPALHLNFQRLKSYSTTSWVPRPEIFNLSCPPLQELLRLVGILLFLFFRPGKESLLPRPGTVPNCSPGST